MPRNSKLLSHVMNTYTAAIPFMFRSTIHEISQTAGLCLGLVGTCDIKHHVFLQSNLEQNGTSHLLRWLDATWWCPSIRDATGLYANLNYNIVKIHITFLHASTWSGYHLGLISILQHGIRMRMNSNVVQRLLYRNKNDLPLTETRWFPQSPNPATHIHSPPILRAPTHTPAHNV